LRPGGVQYDAPRRRREQIAEEKFFFDPAQLKAKAA
jgi:hypothetical protein